jgi:hypothetical protein
MSKAWRALWLGWALLALAGCREADKSTAPAPKGEGKAAAKEEAKDEEHVPPHGGTLVELGEEEAQIEFVLDAAEGKLTVYFFDGEAEKPLFSSDPQIEVDVTPADQPDAKPTRVVLKAVASVLTGEKVGETSQFAGSAPVLKGLTKFAGELQPWTMKASHLPALKFDFPKAEEADEAKTPDEGKKADEAQPPGEAKKP